MSNEQELARDLLKGRTIQDVKFEEEHGGGDICAICLKLENGTWVQIMAMPNGYGGEVRLDVEVLNHEP